MAQTDGVNNDVGSPSPDEIRLMRRALHLGEKAAGDTGANPMVGAIIVHQGRVIGQGYHRRFGGPHAEIEAISDCCKKGYDSSGATMIVTLEPCCHVGKTPPCTDAIIRAGIKRVVVATLDDTEKVAGKGVKLLTENGISVVVGCLEDQARRLNQGFFKLNSTGMPLVILKWAQSINGKLAWPKAANRRWITSDKARRHVHQLRRQCGAILVGIDTVLADDPELTVRLPGRHPQPVRVVLDRQLRIPLDSQLLKTARDVPLLLVTSRQSFTESSLTEKLDSIRQMGGEILPVDEHYGLLDIQQVLEELGRRTLTSALVEGGARVHKTFLKRGFADRMMIYIAPVVIPGAEELPSVDDLEQQADWHITRTRKIGDDILIEADIIS